MMIVITCLSGVATGGTELLHQLGYKLNLFGFEAGIYYFGGGDGKPAVHPYFLKYSLPVIDEISDGSDNIIVHPEMMASSISDIRARFPHSKHILWWLSVDNANMTPELEEQISKDNGIIHMVQSYYALDYVKNTLKVPDERLFYLSDYINYNFLNIENGAERDNTVLFNPRKGFERTAGLIASSDLLRIRWRELAGIAPEKIPDVLRSAKVYIDFGNHPGKDRFPREAVACGCRLITGRRGSAGNDLDVPIPDRFKINDDTDDAAILERIYSLVDDYDQTEWEYSGYRQMIDEEFHTFETDTLTVFSNITGRSVDHFDQDEDCLRELIVGAVSNEEYRKALYLITVYRMKQYDISEDVLILEGYTRLGLPAEIPVALYLMNKVLAENETNYEAYLIKARALIALGKDGANDAFDSAVRYSTGTDDEEYVRELIKLFS